MKILLVGQGVWATKIKGALERFPESQLVSTISARTCIKKKEFLSLNLGKFDVVWICTRPEWQIDLLEEINDYSGRIIIEKPYLTDESSISRLLKIAHRKEEKLQLSQPWTYTKIWSKTKQLLTEKNFNNIKILRGGCTGHYYMNEVLDWLPHDVNLLFDLFEQRLLTAQFKNIEWAKNNKTVSFRIVVEQTTNIDVKIGELDGSKSAIWKFGNIQANYNESYILNQSLKTKILETKNPFLTQLEVDLKSKADLLKNQLRVHEVFRSALFNH